MDQIISADNRILQEQLQTKVTSKSRTPFILLFFFIFHIQHFLVAIISVILTYIHML